MNGSNRYFIEVRVVGRPKYDAQNIITTLYKRFKIKASKIVPHIRLIGPFDTFNEPQLIRDFEAICINTEMMDYKICGANIFNTTGVLYLGVEQNNNNLENVRSKFRDKLQSYCDMSHWDFVTNNIFHITLMSKIPSDLITPIYNYISCCKPFEYDCSVLRLTLLKNGRTLCEYDFVDRCVNDFRNITPTASHNKSIAKFFAPKNMADQSVAKVYFVADTHFSDINVIDRCKRPYIDVETMNTSIVCNWNSMVTPKDTVYFLGDFTYFGCYTEEFDHWIHKLNGRIIFIKGNHDRNIDTNLVTLYNNATLDIEGYKFFMVHDPKRIPEHIKNNKDIWIIHGHTHNERLELYPFINYETRYINVSVDVTSFRPICLSEIVKLIKNRKNHIQEITPLQSSS